MPSKGFVIFVIAAILLLAAIAVPSFIKARNTSCQNACINNLRMIDSGKEQAALANKWRPGDECTPSRVSIVNSYIKGDSTPECPHGGAYTYNPIGINPICVSSAPSQIHPGRMHIYGWGPDMANMSAFHFAAETKGIFKLAKEDLERFMASGSPSGRLLSYSPENAITGVSDWTQGMLHGRKSTWKPDGTPISESYYENGKPIASPVK